MDWLEDVDPPIVAPSVLAANFANLEKEFERVHEANADWVHVDPMDGHFVDNLTMGPFILETIRQLTPLPLDVHLMLERPEAYISDFIDAGADLLSIHIEAMFPESDRSRKEEGWTLRSSLKNKKKAYEKANRIIDRCHRSDTAAGIVINPGTPAEVVEPLVEKVDLVLVMTVWPGFGGQSFLREPLDKVQHLRSASNDPEQIIEVDGGISPETIESAAKAGANAFVSGSATFGADDMTQVVESMRTAAGERLVPT